ncbi:MAG: DNA repair protein RadA [Patescibacteria group bacterium]|nr:DNA repair protein RadA [Patescibacteria group bacterium]
MPQPTTVYVCANCDAQSPKWLGQCPECGAWGTVQAETVVKGAGAAKAAPISVGKAAAVTAFDQVSVRAEDRVKTGLDELDRVFGGGIVPGSVTLLGGEPGVGKSTVALMVAARLANKGLKTLYVSGEESASQVKLRADRLGLGQKNAFFLAATDVDTVIATLEKERPALAIVDSVQMLRSPEVPSEAGAVSQVRAAAGKLVACAKANNLPILLIGHVTKDGLVAGPKTLEHVVDTVLSFEGERGYPIRILRALKNRFGSTDETGIFEMTDAGLSEIGNPSGYLLEEREPGVPGGAVSCVMEGTRPMLIEIQALVRKTSFGYPTRKCSGFDLARLEMLLAVLAKRAGLDLGGHDVFVNVVGGLKVSEPAPDLAVLLALASAYHERPLPAGLVAWGEVGLAGEIRPSPAADRRLAEAAALGLTEAIAAWPKRGTSAKQKTPPKGQIRLTEARSISEALKAALAKR